jgi:peptide-methionine (S)-S-oxide reductase
VIRTRVGYCGGTAASPAYHAIGDHSEAVEIDFDPETISFGQILSWFWVAHDPIRPSVSTQYRSAIFFHGEEQARIAAESKKREENRRGRTLTTQIEPATVFTRAEDYHQKYLLRRETEILREFEGIYADPAVLTDSTAAARVNGYLGGYGTFASLERDFPRLGLSAGAKRILRRCIERASAEQWLA